MGVLFCCLLSRQTCNKDAIHAFVCPDMLAVGRRPGRRPRSPLQAAADVRVVPLVVLPAAQRLQLGTLLVMTPPAE